MGFTLFLIFCFALAVTSRANGAALKRRPRSPEEVDFSTCKTLSVKLNKIARDMYKAEYHKIEGNIVNPHVSITSRDTCDPRSLHENTEMCQSRIVQILKNYTRIFHKDGMFQNSICGVWREQANHIADITRELLQKLNEAPEKDPHTPDSWNLKALCWDSVERLYSFSITNARIFSFLADPVPPQVNSKQC